MRFFDHHHPKTSTQPLPRAGQAQSTPVRIDPAEIITPRPPYGGISIGGDVNFNIVFQPGSVCGIVADAKAIGQLAEAVGKTAQLQAASSQTPAQLPAAEQQPASVDPISETDGEDISDPPRQTT